MSKKMSAGLASMTLLITVGLVLAQPGAGGGAGGRRGQPRMGPPGGPMGQWFDDIEKAYQQKDMDKIGELIAQMKERRAQFQGRVRPGGPAEGGGRGERPTRPGQSRGGPGGPGGGNFGQRVMGLDKNGEGKDTKDEVPKQIFKVFSVGTVEKKAGTTCLKIADEYAEALKGLDGFSHVVVLYWFHKNDTPSKRSILQTRLERFPNKPLAGVFACRPPVGPNLIGLSTCRILSVEGNTVRVAGIDAFDGTPILSLKPHIPMIDSPSNVKLPDWWQPGFGGFGGQGRGGPGGPGGGNFVERVMGFDKNGDGKVTKDEMPNQMQERILQRADTNGDGAIDKEEVKKFAEQMGQGRGGR